MLGKHESISFTKLRSVPRLANSCASREGTLVVVHAIMRTLVLLFMGLVQARVIQSSGVCARVAHAETDYSGNEIECPIGMHR